jgi:uncharacterized protein YbjT (DUF2867 family)
MMCVIDVAQEIIDVLVAQKKHDILILSRKVRVSSLYTKYLAIGINYSIQDAPAGESTQGITWLKADYGDPKQLEQILQGVDTLLSFVATQEDPSSTVQKNLIDAAIKAGVKRFAPSEWSTYDIHLIYSIFRH